MDKGDALNKRVWSLFEKAGFETQPNSSDPAEHIVQLSGGAPRPVDLFARALGVIILGSNKARKKLKSYTAHIHDLEELQKASGASVSLFVAAEKEMLQKERDYAAQRGVRVWDERQLSYYEAVADALGLYAKYEIIHSLGLTTTEETLKDTVLGLRLRQPRSASVGAATVEMYMFTVPAEKLLKTSVVLRKAQGSAFAYQRVLSKRRLPQIGNFVRTPEALLPTNIIVALSDDVRIDDVQNDFKDQAGHKVSPSRGDHQLVSITLPLKYGSLEVIDGQHRLFGFIHADESARKHFNLVVLGIRDIEERRKSAAFIAINDNARRVDANLVSYLRYTDNEKTCRENADLMAIKIVVELNKQSPFRNSVRLLDFGPQRLTLKGLSGYDLRGLVSPKGLLRNYYPENKSKVYIRVLRKYFSTIREAFTAEWDSPELYITATNRGITAFLKLLRSILKTEQKRITKPIVKKYIAALKKHWPQTWETRKLQKSYVGSQGWKQFHLDMVASIRKQYKSFQE